MFNGIDMHSFISISFHISFAVYHKNEIIVHLSMNVQIYSFSFVWINILCSFVKVCISLHTSNNKHLSAVGNWTEMYDWKQDRVQYPITVKVEITKHSQTNNKNIWKHYLCLSWYMKFYSIVTKKEKIMIDDFILLYFPWFDVKVFTFTAFLFVFT